MHRNIIQVSRSPRLQPVFYEFDVYIKAATLIQKAWRGYFSRKRVCNFRVVKWAALKIEQFFVHLRSSWKKKVKDSLRNLELASSELIGLIKLYEKGERDIQFNFSKEPKVSQTVRKCRSKIASAI